MNNVKNAAPIGIICSGEDIIVCRIFKGSKTLDNILSTKKFTINITHDAELFLLSTIGNLPKSYFNDDNSIKNVAKFISTNDNKLRTIVIILIISFLFNIFFKYLFF